MIAMALEHVASFSGIWIRACQPHFLGDGDSDVLSVQAAEVRVLAERRPLHAGEVGTTI
jgi:hypothetical protein